LSTFVFSGSLFGQKQLVFRIDHIQKVSKKELPFTDSLSLQRQIANVQFQAYKKGYLTFSVDSLVKADSITTFAYGSLGEQFQSLNLTISPANRKLLRSIGFSPKTLESNKPDPQSIANTLQSILKKLENSGYPFAKVGFKTLAQSEGKLYTELVIDPSFRLKWNKLEITGNNIKISPKFIAAYLHLEEGAWYEQDVVELIPVRMKQLTYLRETKPAELLFTPEGVTLYLYLESKPVSSFNGTVGLQQNPVTLNYQFTGDLRLKLQNAFKRGELMEFNWRSVSPGSPQLKTQVTLPFLLNTPFGLDGQFQLVKSDSTYLELKSSAGVSYFLSAGNTLKGFYRNYSSSVLGSNSSSLIGNVKNNQYGLSLSHQTIDYLPNPRKGFIWYIEGSAGKRKLTKDTFTQNALVYFIRKEVCIKTRGKRRKLHLG
jgi:outer membrane protein assembly factor BamA